jgi:capsular polysaccharide biosynthesis protein
VSTHRTRSPGVRDLLRWWPLVLLTTALAVGGSVAALHQQVPGYTATTRIVVTPLAQWDETFIGTSLIRDAADPKSTATTVATMLDTPRNAAATATALGWTQAAVADEISVAVVPESNVIEVRAHSADRAEAEKLASTFATVALADRWAAIETELDARIAALTATTAPDPNAGEASGRLQTLTLIRASGSDPTMRIASNEAAVADDRMPASVVIAAAAAGGLFVGGLLAFALARLRRAPAADGTE